MIVDGIQKSSILIDQISILLLEVRNFTHPRDECPKWLGYLGETPFCYVSFGYIELLFCRLGPKNSSRSGAATFQQTKGLLKRRGIMGKKHSLAWLFLRNGLTWIFMILWMYILYTVWYTYIYIYRQNIYVILYIMNGSIPAGKTPANGEVLYPR